MPGRKRISLRKRVSKRLRKPADEGVLSAEAVDTYLLPDKRKIQAYNISAREIGAEAARRRFAELERHFRRD
jgi:hypothetical protein